MILVTGATGHVGGELVRQLLDTEQEVRVLTRDVRRVAHLAEWVECAGGDLDNPATLGDAMRSIDRMFLIMPGFRFEQIVHAIEAAKRGGVRQVVFMSSVGASLEPAPRIGQWHREAEQVIEASGLAHTILRPSSFMTNALQWADTIRSEGAVYHPTGDGKFAPIDPYDIAAVTMEALTTDEHEGKFYEITGPQLLTAREQTDILSSVLGRPVRYVDMSVTDAAEKLRKSGASQLLVDAIAEVMAIVRSGGEASMITNTVKRVTGRVPRTFKTWCGGHLADFE